jgi:CubicO group peptidase (beta-lactamase class C family)
VSHGGGDAGYRTYVVWFPEHQLGVAVLGNAGNFNSAGLANQVAAGYLSDRMEPETQKPVVAREYVSVDPATLDRYAGAYRLAMGIMVEIESKGGKLMGAPLGRPKSESPLAANRFVEHN